MLICVERKKQMKKIYNYLITNGIYYAKDIFVGQVDLFLMEYDLFVDKFEKLKRELGDNYVELLAEDSSLIDIMYN